MLLDLLRQQGQPANAHGISHARRPFTSLQEELSFTEILTSCLSETSSPLLYAQQEGVRVTGDIINNIHTHHSRFKSQNLPLKYRSPLHILNPQDYQNKLECAPSMYERSCRDQLAELYAHAICTRSCNSDIETLAWASRQSSLHEAPNPSTSTATSEPSSTLDNLMNACDFAPVQAWPQQSSDRNGDIQKIKDAAQHSCQTSLDEGSSMQESLSYKDLGHEDACRRTGTHANPVDESCSFDNCGAHYVSEWAGADDCTVASRPAARKRKRSRSCKNSEEVESQRMTHIAVERNRRKQMNENLSVLRSLIPATYIQRGDQASVIGGAIDFVKELEHVLQALQTQKKVRRLKVIESSSEQGGSLTFEEPMRIKQEFPYSRKHVNDYSSTNILDDKFTHVTCEGVDVDVRLIGTCAMVKVLAKKLPHQLLKVAISIESFHIRIMHLNITTIDKSVLYSFNLEVQGDSPFQSANGIAQLVQNVFRVEDTL